MSQHRRSLHSFSAKLDYYKILRVSRDASPADIKLSYRQLAMEFHPDRHDGCSDKEAQFKQINEAYSVLMDAAKKREYDVEFGKKLRPENFNWQYRKVYAPAPPPEWKGGVWNHKYHYDMHYGEGFQKEAFKKMREAAKKEGAYTYQSPLGRGFTFDATGDASSQHNPYSKAPQGPPKVTMEYEEIERDMVTGKEHVLRRERVVEDLYQRRQERYNSTNTRPNTPVNAAFARRQQHECVIL